jgi:hypothetical protein
VVPLSRAAWIVIEVAARVSGTAREAQDQLGQDQVKGMSHGLG